MGLVWGPARLSQAVPEKGEGGAHQLDTRMWTYRGALYPNLKNDLCLLLLHRGTGEEKKKDPRKLRNLKYVNRLRHPLSRGEEKKKKGEKIVWSCRNSN